MVAFLQTDEIEVERTTVKVTVPNNNVARLMYYLNCVFTAIDCKNDADIQRFISYENWHRLSIAEQKAHVVLCYTISPDLLINKVFFQNDALCFEFSNEFYQISQVRNQLLAAESIIIAGRTRQVNKIMVFKQEWLRDFYFNPIQQLAASFSNSASSAVTYTRSNTAPQPVTYTYPVVVQPNNSNKSKYICCCICCCILLVLPTIIGIIIGLIDSRK